ncbi:MAG: ABC transporter ATP-binding protein, partial [Bacilli bacterium]
YEKFSDLSKNMTTLIITHHLVSAKYADSIIVLENGLIIEQGNHNELMNKKGKYFKMFNAQKESYEKT